MTDGTTRPRAVLFDRDNTLVVDVPYNGDPALVVAMPTAIETVAALRAAGIPMAVVSNQSGVARGLITREQVDAVNAEVDRLIGPFDAWCVCPHGEGDGCPCRKPQPGLVLDAAARLGVAPADVVVIGDIGADVGAARAAGASHVLVPTAITLQAEIDGADLVAADLAEAVRLVFGDALVAAPATGGTTAHATTGASGAHPQADTPVADPHYAPDANDPVQAAR